MREDFLETWDGIAEPNFHWEPGHSQRKKEYLGMHNGSLPDQHGPRHYPVGQVEFAR